MMRYVLGSRSPRRLELLSLLLPADPIVVLPPRSTEEAGFDGLYDWNAIERRLAEIASSKCRDVIEQHQHATRTTSSEPAADVIIAADTIIVVSDSEDRLRVLGQPPDIPEWRDTVRQWFRSYYFGRTHEVATAVVVAKIDGMQSLRIVRTRVTFAPEGERWLEWYLGTGESIGKAGGYGIQGSASLFVQRVEGSLTNVIGLPLRELAEMLAET